MLSPNLEKIPNTISSGHGRLYLDTGKSKLLDGEPSATNEIDGMRTIRETVAMLSSLSKLGGLREF